MFIYNLLDNNLLLKKLHHTKLRILNNVVTSHGFHDLSPKGNTDKKKKVKVKYFLNCILKSVEHAIVQVKVISPKLLSHYKGNKIQRWYTVPPVKTPFLGSISFICVRIFFNLLNKSIVSFLPRKKKLQESGYTHTPKQTKLLN